MTGGKLGSRSQIILLRTHRLITTEETRSRAGRRGIGVTYCFAQHHFKNLTAKGETPDAHEVFRLWWRVPSHRGSSPTQFRENLGFMPCRLLLAHPKDRLPF